LVPFERAGQIMVEIGGLEISSSSVWRRVAKWGERMAAVEALEQVQAYGLEESGEVDPNRSGAPLGAAMDGGMVNIRDEGWKELKAGCVFEVGQRSEMDPQTQEMLTVGCAVNNRYVAHLGGPEVFGRKLWAAARQRHWWQAKDSLVIGDGASWIWNLAGEHFHDSQQVVDWYHAAQHLANAGKVLYGEGSPRAQRWVHSQRQHLYQGHARQIANRLTRLAEGQPQLARELQPEIGYFQNNARRMQYLELRENGFPIGSGMVESAAKQYKARFAGPGMRWSRAGAERLLPVRTAIMSKRFDNLWNLAYNSPPN
jgi:hypothetical protein